MRYIGRGPNCGSRYLSLVDSALEPDRVPDVMFPLPANSMELLWAGWWLVFITLPACVGDLVMSEELHIR